MSKVKKVVKMSNRLHAPKIFVATILMFQNEHYKNKLKYGVFVLLRRLTYNPTLTGLISVVYLS